MPDVSKCLNIRAAADMAGVQHGTIQAAIERGELTAHPTIDGTRLLLATDVQAWIDAGKRGERRRGRPAKAVV